MMVLETMDYSMIDIVKKGPHVSVYHPMKDNVQEGELFEQLVHEFKDEEECS